MNYRPLGATGLRVSEIGFGTWGLGGDTDGAVSYGATNDDTSRAALHCAAPRGAMLGRIGGIGGPPLLPPYPPQRRGRQRRGTAGP